MVMMVGVMAVLAGFVTVATHIFLKELDSAVFRITADSTMEDFNQVDSTHMHVDGFVGHMDAADEDGSY